MRRATLTLLVLVAVNSLATGAENNRWDTCDGKSFDGIIFDFRVSHFNLYDNAGVEYIQFEGEKTGRRLSVSGEDSREFVNRVLARYNKTIGGVIAEKRKLARMTPKELAQWQEFNAKSDDLGPFAFVVVKFRADDDALFDCPLDLLSDEHQKHPHLLARYELWYLTQTKIANLEKQVAAITNAFALAVKANAQAGAAPQAAKRSAPALDGDLRSRRPATEPPEFRGLTTTTPRCPLCDGLQSRSKAYEVNGYRGTAYQCAQGHEWFVKDSH